MTVETIKTIIEALEFCGKQKARELEEFRSKREQIRGCEEPVKEQFQAAVEESELRDEFKNVVKALAEFKRIKVEIVKEKESVKPFWKRW